MLIYQMFQYLRAQALFGKQIRRADGCGNSGDLQVQHVENLRNFWMFFRVLTGRNVCVWCNFIFTFTSIDDVFVSTHLFVEYFALSCLDVLSKPSNDVEVLQTKWARRLRSLRKFRSERIPSAKPNGIPAFGPVGILNTDRSIDFDGKRYLERIHQIYLNEPWWTTNWGYRNNMARLGVILFKKKNICTKNHEEKTVALVFFLQALCVADLF